MALIAASGGKVSLKNFKFRLESKEPRAEARGIKGSIIVNFTPEFGGQY